MYDIHKRKNDREKREAEFREMAKRQDEEFAQRIKKKKGSY